MNKLYISSGHMAEQNPGTIQDFGASSQYGRESIVADEFVELLIEECNTVGIDVVTDSKSNTFLQTIKHYLGLVKPVDLAIDIHFNAATPKATGTEIIVPNQYSTKEFSIAYNLAKIISEELSISNRGVKTESDTPRKKLGWMRLPCETVLIEVCFITNRTDMENYHDFKFVCAKKIVEYLKSI